MRTKHINETDKTAKTLCQDILHDDYYHAAIYHGACVMVQRKQHNWIYHTQFGSGSTLWVSPNGEAREIVQLCENY